ncbi:hypothetical protein HHK36_027092 [Tetracentron sinense]|uniref:ER lumen protein-retaining receptor n=1 Tax=Tetracentron sinense TaxID=13715 RepID=A0A834YGR5_TETSI|nr:hypothetical protein HHK36_027092 [Tetracentron sinense]
MTNISTSSNLGPCYSYVFQVTVQLNLKLLDHPNVSYKILFLKDVKIYCSFPHVFSFLHLHNISEQVMWTFSFYLEAVAILPQLVLLQRTRNIDNLTGQYVFLLGQVSVQSFPTSRQTDSHAIKFVVDWVKFADVESEMLFPLL